MAGVSPKAELLALARKQGVQQLSDRALLTLLLDAKVANLLLAEYDNLFTLLRASRTELCQYSGVTENVYIKLQASIELTNRYFRANLANTSALDNPQAVVKYLTAQLGSLEHEVFCCLWLDSQHRLLEVEQLFRGSIKSANIYPREVIKSALKYNAAAVILAHNHPSGSVEPSDADIQITRALARILEHIDVAVLDHIIIGNNQHSSLRASGIHW